MTRFDAATVLHCDPVDVWLIRKLPNGHAVYVHQNAGIVAHQIRADGLRGRCIRLTPEQFLVERQKVKRTIAPAANGPALAQAAESSIRQ